MREGREGMFVDCGGKYLNSSFAREGKQVKKRASDEGSLSTGLAVQQSAKDNWKDPICIGFTMANAE